MFIVEFNKMSGIFFSGIHPQEWKQKFFTTCDKGLWSKISIYSIFA